jgi:hypothetical protein
VAKNSRHFAVFISGTIIVALLLLISFNNSFGNSTVSFMITQSTPTPETPTITPTLEPTPTNTPFPTATPNPTLIPIPVKFSCGEAGNPYAFSVTVAVDLNNGMDKAEAITVAEAIINHELTNASYEVKSSDNNAGLWNVNFSWECTALATDGTLHLGHIFDVIINPFNQTVKYTRCM